ncbi:MAG: hypothetical protein IJA26_07495, partial [Clostridia bacterium]|nr:hypothetical protein [Clostridia bacterium]
MPAAEPVQADTTVADVEPAAETFSVETEEVESKAVESEEAEGEEAPAEGETTSEETVETEGEAVEGKEAPAEGETTSEETVETEGEAVEGEEAPAEGETTSEETEEAEGEAVESEEVSAEAENTSVETVVIEGEVPADETVGENEPGEDEIAVDIPLDETGSEEKTEVGNAETEVIEGESEEEIPAEEIEGDAAEEVTEGQTSVENEIIAEAVMDIPVVLAGAGAEGAEITDPVGADAVIDEPYSAPLGSAYIKEIGSDILYENSAESNAIQQAVNGALAYIKGLYDADSEVERTATIVVQNGTYEGGVDVSSLSSNGVLAELINSILGMTGLEQNTTKSLTLNIVAEDAYTEDENGNMVFNSESAGNVNVEGDVNVNMNGLNLVLAGLYLSTRGIVNVEGAESVEIYGTKRDDHVVVNAKRVSKRAKIDTGAGNDNVEVALQKKPSVESFITVNPELINSFSGLRDIAQIQDVPAALQPIVIEMTKLLNEGINADLENPGVVDVEILLGEGNDAVDFTLVDSTDIIYNMDSVTLATTVGFQIDMTAASVAVDGGSGDDRIDMAGARSLTLGQNVAGAILNYVAGMDLSKLPETTIGLAGGAGDDLLTVNTTSAFTTFGGVNIATDGAAGFDRLHLTGKLNNTIDEDARISLKTIDSDNMEVAIEAMAQITVLDDLTDGLHLDTFHKMIVQVKNMDALTDALENKRTINVSAIVAGDEAKSFTDYVVNPVQGVVDFNLADTGIVIPDSGLVLTNVVVSAPDLTINRLAASGMNLLVTGERIDVAGSMVGRNILIGAYAEDAALAAIETTIVDNDLSEPVPGEDSIEEGEGFSVEMGIYEADQKAFIKIGENASLLAAEAVDMVSKLVLDKAFLPGADYIEGLLDKQFNPITLKFGTSEIDIFGSVYAGGYVHARSDVDVNIEAS